MPKLPFFLICNDSAEDTSRVPAGKALMKLVVGPLPYNIQGDTTDKVPGTTWDEAKEAFADYIIGLITKNYIPDLADKIMKRVVHSPVDLENKLPSALRGTITHGVFVPYQTGAMRPVPELGNYKSSINNVYLCGSGSHPGTGVTMAPGRNAVQIIYRDLKLDFSKNIGDCAP